MKQRRRLKLPAGLPVFAYLLLYGLLSASFLTRFPFVHSDEAWLAGLSRDMEAAKNLGITESFFDLKPRIPHALKLIFHVLQIGYIRIFGYNIQSLRLLSLTAGLICLFLLCRIGKELGGKWAGAALMVLTSLDTQFIYASHFARQEILLSISLLSCLLILIKCQGRPSSSQAAGLALITGLSTGIHPNSFLCASLCGCVMAGPAACSLAGRIRSLRPGGGPRPTDSPLSCTGQRGDRRFWSRVPAGNPLRLPKAITPLALYIFLTGALASLFVGISFHFDPGFFPGYFRYGEQEFELSSRASHRISQFLYYLQSIFRQESGTYYLPDLRLELILMAICALLLALSWLVLKTSAEKEAGVWRRRTQVLLLAAAGLGAGMVVIGRYNQTSILFFLLLGWAGAVQLFLLFESAGRKTAAWAALAFLLVSGYTQIVPWLRLPDYSFYLGQLELLVPSGARVIANLNTEFYFDQGVLRDYRNLPYLKEPGALENYIQENKIQYILLSDELDYIYENRPYYNVIYGNASFIKDLKAYCLSSCTVAGSFENPLYGPRIISLVNDPQHGAVTVYKVEDKGLR
ncbi:MAG: glycosyltransferase family 39 protein [Clostridium sp.]|nr:glycosyltransferase family 39 protein [Clostridium sp.]